MRIVQASPRCHVGGDTGGVTTCLKAADTTMQEMTETILSPARLALCQPCLTRGAFSSEKSGYAFTPDYQCHSTSINIATKHRSVLHCSSTRSLPMIDRKSTRLNSSHVRI